MSAINGPAGGGRQLRPCAGLHARVKRACAPKSGQVGPLDPSGRKTTNLASTSEICPSTPTIYFLTSFSSAAPGYGSAWKGRNGGEGRGRLLE